MQLSPNSPPRRTVNALFRRFAFRALGVSSRGLPTTQTLMSKIGVGVDPHHDHSRQRAGASQVSCRTAPTIDHTEPSSIAAKPASSPGVLRHLRRFSYSVTSLEAMTLFARRSEHGLSDGMWYALEGCLAWWRATMPAPSASASASAKRSREPRCVAVQGSLPHRRQGRDLQGGHQGLAVPIFKERYFLPEYRARIKRAYFTHACST